MHELGMSHDWFVFMWRIFHISSVNLSDIDKEQDDCYVGGNEESEENALTGDPIDRHQHKSLNVEQNDTDTSTNQQHNIVEIEASSASDSNCSAVDVSDLEGTSDTNDEVDPIFWLSRILLLLLIFRKASLQFIVVLVTYSYIDATIMYFMDCRHKPIESRTNQ